MADAKQPTYDYHIILCPSCKGEGTQSRIEVTDYYRMEDRVITFTCPTCKGSGRLRAKTKTEYEHVGVQ